MKYFVELSMNLGITEKKVRDTLKEFPCQPERLESGGEKGVGRWYNFPVPSLKLARKFRTWAKKTFKEHLHNVRIFRRKVRIIDDSEFVE